MMETEFGGLLEHTQMVPLDDWRCFDDFAIECRVDYRMKFVVICPMRLVDISVKHKRRLGDLRMWNPLVELFLMVFGWR